MPDCTSLEAAYVIAEAAEAVAHATWAVEQAEADLAYQDAMDATTAKWVAWYEWMMCETGGGSSMRTTSPTLDKWMAFNANSNEERIRARELRVKRVESLRADLAEAVTTLDQLRKAAN